MSGSQTSEFQVYENYLGVLGEEILKRNMLKLMPFWGITKTHSTHSIANSFTSVSPFIVVKFGCEKLWNVQQWKLITECSRTITELLLFL